MTAHPSKTTHPTRTHPAVHHAASNTHPDVEIEIEFIERSTEPEPQPYRDDGQTLSTPDPHEWVAAMGIQDTARVPLPTKLIDEVIGQDEAVAVARKAATQRRHLLLLGDPGTGKSMIAKAMAEILPDTKQNDIILHGNKQDENRPRVQVTPGAQGAAVVRESRDRAGKMQRVYTTFEWAVSLSLVGAGFWALFGLGGGTTGMVVMVLCLMAAIFFIFVAKQSRPKIVDRVPNLLIERRPGSSPAPYVDSTGSRAGALLGDVRHDPFQSGGLETPTHHRVEPGAIHRADKGILFIDEINVLRLDAQQALLTAMQDRAYAISGQSEQSSGAMVRTDAIPCDFILVAAGNMDVLQPSDARYTGLHPALRSRIRGYGYEVYVASTMNDTDTNRLKLVRFIAQEVRRDGQIPHFDGAAVAEILREAQRRSGRTGKLTLRLRELGGLVRTAGDLARDGHAVQVTVDHVLAAKDMSMSLEYQVTRRSIEATMAREALDHEGTTVGFATGCAIIGTGETGEPAGVVVPIEAEATPAIDAARGAIHLGGGLETDPTITQNLGAILKRAHPKKAPRTDMHIQALLQQAQARVDGLGAAATVAALSAMDRAAVRRDTIILGAVSVSGRIRPVDGITQMVEAAADLGYRRAIVPASSRADILLEHRYRDRIEILEVQTVDEARAHAYA